MIGPEDLQKINEQSLASMNTPSALPVGAFDAWKIMSGWMQNDIYVLHCLQIRQAVEELWSELKIIDHFTDHGPKHSDRILVRITYILQSHKITLSPIEGLSRR